MTDLITRFKQTCAELNPDLDLSLNECDDNAFLDPITEAHWQGYQMANRWNDPDLTAVESLEKVLAYDCFGNYRIISRYQARNSGFYSNWIPLPIPPLTTKGGE